MGKRDDILDGAERLFYQEGFHATGIDRIVAEARVTPRTLYRHFCSKEALVHAVLERREARFLEALDTALAADGRSETDRWLHLFAGIEAWFTREGALGCMFLKALAEYGQHDDAISALVLRHKRQVLAMFRARIAAGTLTSNAELAEQLLLLIEGAVALAPVIGGSAATRHAGEAAACLLKNTATQTSAMENDTA